MSPVGSPLGGQIHRLRGKGDTAGQRAASSVNKDLHWTRSGADASIVRGPGCQPVKACADIVPGNTVGAAGCLAQFVGALEKFDSADRPVRIKRIRIDCNAGGRGKSCVLSPTGNPPALPEDSRSLTAPGVIGESLDS